MTSEALHMIPLIMLYTVFMVAAAYLLFPRKR